MFVERKASDSSTCSSQRRVIVARARDGGLEYASLIEGGRCSFATPGGSLATLGRATLIERLLEQGAKGNGRHLRWQPEVHGRHAAGRSVDGCGGPRRGLRTRDRGFAGA